MRDVKEGVEVEGREGGKCVGAGREARRGRREKTEVDIMRETEKGDREVGRQLDVRGQMTLPGGVLLRHAQLFH